MEPLPIKGNRRGCRKNIAKKRNNSEADRVHPAKLRVSECGNLATTSDGIEWILSPFVTRTIELPDGSGRLLELHAELHSSEDAVQTNPAVHLTHGKEREERGASDVRNEGAEPLDIEIVLTDENQISVSNAENDCQLNLISSNIAFALEDVDSGANGNSNATAVSIGYLADGHSRTTSAPSKIAESSAKSVNGDRERFVQCLSGITETFNMSVNHERNANSGRLKSIVVRVSNDFFEFLHSRISGSSERRRLPDETTVCERKTVPPLGKFTKFVWKIGSLARLKAAFDTPTVPLESHRIHEENSCGAMRDLSDDVANETVSKTKTEFAKIGRGSRVTFLKIGKTSSDRMSYFRIEWTPDLLPKSGIGELALKYELECKNNCKLLYDR